MTLRNRLILLWAGFLIVSGALFAELLRERAEAERDAGQRVQGYARLLAEHTAGAIRNAELAAQGLAAHPEVQRTLAAAHGETAGARPPEWPDLETFMRAIPGAINLYVADHRGHVLASAVALPDETSVISAQSLRELAHGKGTGSQVSGTLPDHTSGRQAIQITRRVETHAVPMRDKQGVITGALAITRDISAIRETGALLPADGYTAAELAGKPSAVI